MPAMQSAHRWNKNAPPLTLGDKRKGRASGLDDVHLRQDYASSQIACRAKGNSAAPNDSQPARVARSHSSRKEKARCAEVRPSSFVIRSRKTNAVSKKTPMVAANPR